MSFVIEVLSKQYLVDYGQKVVVDKFPDELVNSELDVPVLFSTEDDKIKKVKVKILENILGEKLRVVRFKAKSTYHRVKGFRKKHAIIEVINPLEIKSQDLKKESSGKEKTSKISKKEVDSKVKVTEKVTKSKSNSTKNKLTK